MRIRVSQSKFALLGAILGALALFCAGCAGSRYMDSLHDHPFCVDQAQIPRFKVDSCMDSSDRRSLNDCLMSKYVPESKIDVLNDCVESHRHGW